MTTARVKLPAKLVPVFSAPLGSYRYRCAYGGRGSGKSFNFAKMAAVMGYVDPIRILCTRKYQVSIKESFHAELRNAIASEPWLEAAYDVGIDYIRGKNGTEFIFRGLQNQMGSIRSTAQIHLTIVEEAEDVPEESWLALEATVFRTDISELWAIWNPETKGSPVDTRFRINPPPNSCIIEMNYMDNPWFPKGMEELRQQQLKTLDAGTYGWVWNGEYNTRSAAQVFAGKYEVKEFVSTPNWNGPYYGVDWGFSKDPTAAVKLWIYDDCLYIEHELCRVGLEIVDTPNALRTIPEIERHTIRADSARPETISHCRRTGLNIVPAVKGAGSVEGGISLMRGFKKIYIHPRCTNALREFKLYSYKTDKLTGDILTAIIDTDNHIIDACRYALEPLLRNSYGGFGTL